MYCSFSTICILHAIPILVSSLCTGSDNQRRSSLSGRRFESRILKRSSCLHLSKTTEGDEPGDEPDLFDYFDPLLSPHAYPGGISPDKHLQGEEVLQPAIRQERPPPKPFGINYYSKEKNAEEGRAQNKKDDEESSATTVSNKAANEPDLFDYFDPLLSPHAYPNGISASSEAIRPPRALEKVEDDEISEKKNGGILNAKKRVIGVLLMDHGSRNPASNERLQRLAELYQLTVEDSCENENYIVRAAHMEIASPTIPDGLKALIDEGVDLIICHPYFLSPGRHVQEDIPDIVNTAVEDLKIEIPITTTAPVGSNTQLMIGAIHSQVLEHTQIVQEK